MQNLPYLVAALACPISMGAMMFFMMRPGAKKSGEETAAQQGEIAELRAQVAELRKQQEPSSDQRPGVGR
jgi:hypothetical protein